MACWSVSRRTLGLSVALCAIGIGTVGSAVAQQKEKERPAIERAAQATAGFTYNVDGYKVQFKPYIETEGGYDSNPDNLFDQDASSFVKLEGGLKLSAEKVNEYYALSLKGRFIDYMDFDPGIRTRPDFKVAVDTSFNLNDKETVKMGSYFLRDLVSIQRVDIFQSSAEYSFTQADYRLKIDARSHIEHNFDNDVQGPTETFNDFSVARARSFDYARSDARINLLTFTREMFQPFVILDGANINYYNQTAGVTVNRDANEVYGIAGARVQFDKNFRVDVGYRLNDRELDDPTIKQFDSNYIDINVFWQPVDGLKLTGIVERFVDEPTESFGRLLDTRSFGLTLDWNIAPQWRLAATGYYDLLDTIGAPSERRKITTTGALTYEPDIHTELFLSGLAKWVDENANGESYNRYKLGTGIRFKF